MGKFLSRIGLALTALYGLLLWFIFNGRLTEILIMAPNNIGDLLAGVFGPLAILWLILGYFQQGIELRQNTEALRLQAEELKKSTDALELQVEEMRRSAEQQTRMAQLAAEQLEMQNSKSKREAAEKAASVSPRFEVVNEQKFAPTAPGIGQVEIVNSGAGVVVTGVKSSFRRDILPKITDWKTGAVFRFVPFREDRPANLPVSISIRFTQSNGLSKRLVISMDDMGSGRFTTAELRVEED